jgi:ribosome-associated protein
MINFKDILNECKFKTARSGGAGGQHVNKVETKVELYWDLSATQVFPEEIKEMLRVKLASYTDSASVLRISSQKTRSQVKNKLDAQAKLKKLIEQALTKKKKRKPTQIPSSVKEKRIQVKRIKSEHKQNRKKIRW